MTRRSKKTGRYIRSRRSPSRVNRTRRRGLSAKKLRAIKIYARKGYSANRIQKRMRRRHIGVRRKTVLRLVRETKGRRPRPHPEKYVRHRYRKPPSTITHRKPSYAKIVGGAKTISLYGQVGGKARRWQISGDGHRIYQLMPELVRHPPKENFETTDVDTLSRNKDRLMSRSTWDGRPQIES